MHDHQQDPGDGRPVRPTAPRPEDPEFVRQMRTALSGRLDAAISHGEPEPQQAAAESGTDNQILWNFGRDDAEKPIRGLRSQRIADGTIEQSLRFSPPTIIRLQRAIGNAAVQRLLAAQRHPAAPPKADTPQAAHSIIQRGDKIEKRDSPSGGSVCTGDEVVFEPLQVSPMQARMLGVYTDEQISQELYGRPMVPIHHLDATRVEVMYSTLLPRWKPAFVLGASKWEREEADKIDPGRGRRWIPLEDPSRGGMVIGYSQSSGGFTEVYNTSGELIFQDEIGIEPVRIPVIGHIWDVLKQAGYVAVGLWEAWLGDNLSALGLPPGRTLGDVLGIPPDAVAYRVGQGAGHAVSMLQAAAEIAGGVALVVGGDGALLIGAATAPVGVGLAIMPVAVATVGVGTVVVIHGGALAKASFMSMSAGSSGGGSEGKKPPQTAAERGQTAAERDWEKAEAEAERQRAKADVPERTEHGALRQQERGALTGEEKAQLKSTPPRHQSNGATAKVLKEGRGRYTVVITNEEGINVSVIRGKTKKELIGLSERYHWNPSWE
jgi:hypothetical protein